MGPIGSCGFFPLIYVRRYVYDSHCNVVHGGGGASRSLQEVVQLCLELPELDVPPVGPVVDGLAQEGHPRIVEAAGGSVVAVAVVAAASAPAGGAGTAAALVIQLEAAREREKKTMSERLERASFNLC